MATITRGATTLTPTLVLGWGLTRRGRSVVHEILGTGEVDITTRTPAPRNGTVRTFWASESAANAALEALSVPGGPWVFDVVGEPLTAYVVGDLSIESATDAARRWVVRVDVQEAGT